MYIDIGVENIGAEIELFELEHAFSLISYVWLAGKC